MLIRYAGMVMLVILTLFLAGCYGLRETDDVAYVLVIGVDKAEGGKQKVTYQTALPRGLSGGGDESSDSSAMDEQGAQKGPWVINSIVIPTPAESRMLLSATMSRVPQLTHSVVFIFSEEVAREGLGPSISYHSRSRELRDTMFLIIVKGTAEEYIKRNNPTLEATITEFYEIFLASASESGYYLPATFRDFYTRLKNSGGSPYAVYSGINPMTGEDKPAGTKTPEQKGDPYLPGGIPRTGTENSIDFAGLAVFRGDKMVGVLNSDETRAVALLQGKFPHGNIGVVDPLQPKKEVINLSVRSGSKPKITAQLNGGAAVFDVEVNIEGEILGITSDINYEAPGYRELMEKQVANLFKGQIMTMLKHTQELGTDPVGFGLYLRPQFRNTGEMEQADMTALYQAADIRVNVIAKIRRTGLTWRSSPQK